MKLTYKYMPDSYTLTLNQADPATEQSWLFQYYVRIPTKAKAVENKVKVIAYDKTEATEKFVKYIYTTYGDVLYLSFSVIDAVDTSTEVTAWLAEHNGGLSEVGAPTLKEATAIIVDWVFDKYPDMSDLSLNIRKMPEKIYINEGASK